MKKSTNGDAPMRNMMARGTRLSGDIDTEGDIRIDGHFTGKINARGKVVIGAEGYVEGQVDCKSIDVSGRLKATVVAEEITVLKSTARVEGDILTPKISIEPGAVFEGHCKMDSSEKQLDEKPKRHIQKSEARSA
ncbi:MAG: polymer-forming cytoskeletal protein [Bacteroidales bacterium]|nr:polymer-forming cytoskeletal protein [Bacteroidales bacterium]